jgi:colanic acid biosynthesis glycosyl transferase WcaI
VLVESPPLLVALPALLHGLVRRHLPMVLLVADLWPDTAAELGLLDYEGRTYRILRRLEDHAYRASWRISPVTEGQVETLVRDKGVDPGKIAFLPNGVDIELFSPSVGPAADQDVEPVLLFAGTLGYAHGLDVVLDAAPLVHAHHPEARFLLVGGGSEKARLMSRVETESIAGIEFHDPVSVEDVAPMFRRCFAGISCIRSLPVLEGARPAKIFPIMASGRPVVYSGSGEGARLVESASAGVVVSPEDSQALAEALVRLLDDPSEADRLGANGRRFVEEHLAWSRLMDQWLSNVGLADPG